MPHDSVGDRRKRGAIKRHPEMQAELDALKAANVPQSVIAEALSDRSRGRSPAKLRAKLRQLMAYYSGTHSKQLPEE